MNGLICAIRFLTIATLVVVFSTIITLLIGWPGVILSFGTGFIGAHLFGDWIAAPLDWDKE